MKKMMAFLLAALMFITISPVKKSKADTMSKENKEIQVLMDEYDLKSVDKAPEGVEPIKFDTAEEAEKFIKKIKAIESQQPDNIDMGVADIDENGDQARPMTWGTERKKFLLGFCYLNIEANIEYLWSSSLGQNYYNKCTSVNSFLDGVYFGSAWTQTSYSANIVDSGRQLNVTVNGKFDYYILINTSLTSLAGTSKSYSASWRNP